MASGEAATLAVDRCLEHGACAVTLRRGLVADINGDVCATGGNQVPDAMRAFLFPSQ